MTDYAPPDPRVVILGLVRMMLARDKREVVKLRAETKPDSRTSIWLTNRHRQEMLEAIDIIDAPPPGLPIVVDPSLPPDAAQLRDASGEVMAEIVRVKG